MHLISRKNELPLSQDSSGLSKTPEELGTRIANRAQRRVRWARAIFAAENPIFQSKNRFPAVFAPENPKEFSKNW